MNELIDPRKAFGEAVIEAAQNNPDVVVLSADSSSGLGLANFPKLFPERHFEFGIMEQGVIGYASGLAIYRKDPCVCCNCTFCYCPSFRNVQK